MFGFFVRSGEVEMLLKFQNRFPDERVKINGMFVLVTDEPVDAKQFPLLCHGRRVGDSGVPWELFFRIEGGLGELTIKFLSKFDIAGGLELVEACVEVMFLKVLVQSFEVWHDVFGIGGSQPSVV